MQANDTVCTLGRTQLSRGKYVVCP